MPGHPRRSVVVATRAAEVVAQRAPQAGEARQMAAVQSGIQQVMAMMAAQTEEISGLKAELEHERSARATLQNHCVNLQQQLRSLHPGIALEPTFEPAA